MSIAYVDTSALIAVAFDEDSGAAVTARLMGITHLCSSNLLEAELRSACSREGVNFLHDLLANLVWVFPDRSLAPEIASVLEVGYLRGADLWYLASALYIAASEPGKMQFIALDKQQSTVAKAVGFQIWNAPVPS